MEDHVDYYYYYYFNCLDMDVIKIRPNMNEQITVDFGAKMIEYAART